jgi:hypothetical protein
MNMVVKPEPVTKLPEISADANSLMSVISRAASDPGYPMENLEKLLAMKERWDAAEAKKAYVRAMNAFKANPPEILKTKHVSYANKTGGKTEYDHATLDEASPVIAEALSKHGLSHHWDVENLEGGIIKVTCVITHELGHSERVSLQAGADQSGGKNNIQAVGSTVTYLQRYTLLSATGTAAKGMDNDGGDLGPKIEVISEEQAANIQALLEEVNADKPRFLKHLSTQCKKEINAISEIPSTAQKLAVDLLESKRKKQ